MISFRVELSVDDSTVEEWLKEQGYDLDDDTLHAFSHEFVDWFYGLNADYVEVM